MQKVWKFALADRAVGVAIRQRSGVKDEPLEVWLDAEVLGRGDDVVALLQSSVNVPMEGLKITANAIRIPCTPLMRRSSLTSRAHRVRTSAARQHHRMVICDIWIGQAFPATEEAARSQSVPAGYDSFFLGGTTHTHTPP